MNNALRSLELLALAACLSLLAACRPPAPPEAPGPPVSPEGTAATAVGPQGGFLGSAGCADCHAEQAEAHASSPHALDVQAVEGEVPHAETGRPVDEESVPIEFRIGTRRRVAWLGAHESSLQVLPSAWSVTRQEWVDHRNDDGRPRGGEGDWKREGSEWRSACAGCHPNAGAASGPEVALSPEGARKLSPGIGCEHCHGAGAAHAELARESPEAEAAIRESILLSGRGPWQGCEACHADGQALPLRRGEALRAGDELSAFRLVDTAIDAQRPDPRFFADGRPGTAHALSVQSLAQSRCFREGEATCLTCHDPHGGGLKDEDPDASCRSCHAAQAIDDHSGHAARTVAVPPSLEEPRGPDASRAPGCVDCHAPAVLSFGAVDRVRDHAFAIPEPELTRDFDIPDACTACHSDRDPEELIDWLTERSPERTTPRHERAAAFRRVLGLSAIGQASLARSAVDPLLALLSDESEDPWLRAAAASMLGVLGAEARPAESALLTAASSDSVELAQAAAAALGDIGSEEIPRLVRLARSAPDWRVRLVAAASLDRIGNAEGAAELEVLASDESLPEVARSHAHLQMGLALLRRGLLARAAFQLEESLDGEPRSVPAWLNLGVARAGLGDEEGARLAWLTVEDLEPGNLAARANLQLLDQRRSERSP